MLLGLSEGGLLNLRGNLYSIREIREGRGSVVREALLVTRRSQR